jgi:sugar transferase (PEP-CTERM/EpsH1 system associated)
VDRVREYCSDLCAPQINPTIARIASLRGLFTGEALSLPYLRNRTLYNWTGDILHDRRPERIVIFSGPMAQYVTGRVPAGATTLFDMVDVDSEKWRSYGARKAWPMSWLYRREADRLLAFERRMATEFDATVFVSKEEAALFRGLAPESAAKTTYRIQGVDSDYFDPAVEHADPYPRAAPVLVFTGAMDYWPNVDAVTWFTEQALPRIRAAVPDAVFCIVGRHPAPAVQKLASQAGILVTGGVPDVRPYLAHARAAALPLRIARGIQNKVLEAMSMQLPVIATPGAMTGIQPFPGSNRPSAKIPYSWPMPRSAFSASRGSATGRRARACCSATTGTPTCSASHGCWRAAWWSRTSEPGQTREPPPPAVILRQVCRVHCAPRSVRAQAA